MNKNSKIKEFYYSKRGKSILFFGFYFFFFLFLAIFFQKVNNDTIQQDDVPINNQPILYLKDLIQNDYFYQIKLNDEENKVVYRGSKNNIDYDSYEYKYFLDIININQLIKHGKLIEMIGNRRKYEILNKDIDNLLETEKIDGKNTIELIESENYLKIIIDLHEYMEKNIYSITLEFKVGDSFE